MCIPSPGMYPTSMYPIPRHVSHEACIPPWHVIQQACIPVPEACIPKACIPSPGMYPTSVYPIRPGMHPRSVCQLHPDVRSHLPRIHSAHTYPVVTDMYPNPEFCIPRVRYTASRQASHLPNISTFKRYIPSASCLSLRHVSVQADIPMNVYPFPNVSGPNLFYLGQDRGQSLGQERSSFPGPILRGL